jgi:hypothetical protein
VSENPPRNEDVPDYDAQPLTGEPVGPAPMRLRAEPPRVTRLIAERCSPASVSSPASGIGGALIYALQTRDAGRPATNSIRPRTARPLTDWPACREITVACRSSARRFPVTSGARSLAPRIADSRCPPPVSPHRAQSRHQPGRAAPAFRRSRPRGPAACSPIGEPGCARCGGGCPSTSARTGLISSLGLAPPPATPTAQDRQLAFLNAAADRADRVARSCRCSGVAEHPSGRRSHLGGAHHRHPIRPSGPDHRAGDGEHL